MKKKNCFILAGELSGEEHAMTFLPKLINENRNYHFWGVGGQLMRQLEVELLYSTSEFSSMGFTEVFKKLSFYKQARKKIIEQIKERQTSIAILIDFQGFNMSLLKSLYENKVKILYFVAPQAWAWKSWRTKILSKFVSSLYCILPFEEQWFKSRGVYQAQSVAHPSFSKIPQLLNKFPTDKKLMLWLPGSRKSEIDNHWSLFKNVQKMVVQQYPDIQHAVVTSPAFIELGLENDLDHTWNRYDSEELFKVLSRATIAVAVSGTVTLNCAFMKVPTVVCYRVNNLNAWIFKSFIQYKGYVSLANLMLNKSIFPELLQEDCNQGLIFLTLKKWLENPQLKENVISELEALVGTQVALKESAFSSMDQYFKSDES